MKKKDDSRRHFLKNVSLSLLSATVFPATLKSGNPIALERNTHSKPICNQSTEDIYGQGPFYTPNAPAIQNDKLANISEFGTRIIISGLVYNLQCSEVIPNTEIDVWHANDSGEYDNSGYNLRGKTITNSQGFYIFETIKPGLYLNGTTFRPSHIHFKITPPGFSTLITQLYFEGDPHISSDAAASISSGSFDATNRIIPLIANANGDLEGTWNIVINGDGEPVETNNMYLDKAIIYSARPNPFFDQLEVSYGIFKKAKVSIFVYDIAGQIVASLVERMLDPDKYSVLWNPHNNLPKGNYFLSIMVNEMQVHYIKIFRQ